MVQNGIQFCDACEEEIEKGETYVYYLIDTVEGLARVDVCLDCRMNTHGREMQSAVNLGREAPLPDGWGGRAGVRAVSGKMPSRTGSADLCLPRHCWLPFPAVIDYSPSPSDPSSSSSDDPDSF